MWDSISVIIRPTSVKFCGVVPNRTLKVCSAWFKFIDWHPHSFGPRCTNLDVSSKRSCLNKVAMSQHIIFDSLGTRVLTIRLNCFKFFLSASRWLSSRLANLIITYSSIASCCRIWVKYICWGRPVVIFDFFFKNVFFIFIKQDFRTIFKISFWNKWFILLVISPTILVILHAINFLSPNTCIIHRLFCKRIVSIVINSWVVRWNSMSWYLRWGFKPH